MNDQENIIREYETLREEIKHKIELHNSLITFMITTTVAVLAFALESNNVQLYLLPFCIIIPLSMRVTYYRTVMTKLSAYIIVYIEDKIEGLNWETRNTLLINRDKNYLYDTLTISHYYEGIILGFVCYFLYFFNYMKCNTINFHTIIWLVLPFLLVVWELLITIRIVTFNNEKEKWIKKWKDFRSNE